MKFLWIVIALFLSLSVQASGKFDFEFFSLEELKKNRKAKVYLPKNLNEKRSWPVIISLHGYFSSPNFQNLYFRAKKLVTKKGFILVVPYGSRSLLGGRYWNTEGYCCDFFKQKADDLGFLKKLISSIKTEYPVDPEKVFLVGHSNGGFLAHHYACEGGEDISGIVSISGTGPLNFQNCIPSKPISVLQIHGTKDKIIPFDGEKGKFPGALESTFAWSKLNGCEQESPQDFGLVSKRKNITSSGWKNCRDDKSTLLWTVNGGGHVNPLPKKVTIKILDYLIN